MRSVKIVVVDRNDITRKGLEAVIGDAGRPLTVVAAFPRLRDIDDYLRDHVVDVLVLDDWTLSPGQVARTLTRFCDVYPGLGVVVLSQRHDGEYIQQILRCGSAGFVLKQDQLEDSLLAAIRMVAERYPFLSPEAAKLIGSSREGTIGHRDLDVLRLMAQQMSVKEIGARLNLSPKTIYRSRKRLKRTLGVRSSESLVDAARRQGLLEHRRE